jgi:hypothetical protein
MYATLARVIRVGDEHWINVALDLIDILQLLYINKKRVYNVEYALCSSDCCD